MTIPGLGVVNRRLRHFSAAARTGCTTQRERKYSVTETSATERIELNQRLAQLENDLRRWRRASVCGLLGLLAALVGVTVWGLRPPAIIRAESFVLCDAAGRTRGELKMDSNGSPALGLYDDQGKQRIRLALDVNGWPRLGMTDGSNLRIWMALNSEGAPQLFFRDQQGVKRLDLSLDAVGSSALVMFDPTETPRAAFGLDEQLIPGILLRGRDGVSRANLTIPPEGVPLLGLADKDGTILFRVP